MCSCGWIDVRVIVFDWFEVKGDTLSLSCWPLSYWNYWGYSAIQAYWATLYHVLYNYNININININIHFILRCLSSVSLLMMLPLSSHTPSKFTATSSDNFDIIQKTIFQIWFQLQLDRETEEKANLFKCLIMVDRFLVFHCPSLLSFAPNSLQLEEIF